MENEAKTVDIEEPSNSPQEENKGQGERMFTQDEVNQIVKERLKREKAKPDPELSQRESAISEREHALSQRESALSCREYLVQNGYPAEFMEILDTSNIDEFKKKADRAAELMVRKTASAPPLRVYEDCRGDRIASAFTNTSHRPRHYGYTYEE